MLKITFKNVGQGDSVILEWLDKKVKKIGIVDCNLDEFNKNPVLDHIKYSDYTHINFIILSHPHYDHYSGFNQLLEYCQKENIIIGKFLHTSEQVPDFLRTASRTAKAKRELAKLFLKLRHLRKSNLIQYQSYIDFDRKDLKLNDVIYIRFLAPSPDEKDKYLTGQKVFSEEESPHNNPNANWLCSVLKIYSDSWYVLLTSDVEASVLKKLGIQYKNEFYEEIYLAQSPHHGAKGNHYKSFWRHRLNKKRGLPIVFSVGSNQYNQPAEEAILDFTKYNCKIYSTNQVGHLSQYKESEIEDLNEANAILDFTSNLIESNVKNSRLQGDQVFIIENNQIQYQPV